MTHFIFLFALACAIPQTNRHLPFYLFTGFSLFLFLAFRFGYGNDYMSYMEIHSDLIQGYSAHGGNDFLFAHLNLLVPNFFAFVAIVGAIYICCVCFLIFRNLGSTNAWLGFVILLINPYLFLVHLSSFRQTLAICAFILSIHLLRRKKLFLSLLSYCQIWCMGHQAAFLSDWPDTRIPSLKITPVMTSPRSS